ncbi:hypothetical protein SOM12_18440 [Flavobacterium sp. CFBP9031]|uniref:hypothetical protein n=1 Tax=Flavobacterium sp. CFBP9031 TaxID=3096538 RepID=UPI002A6A06DC|nr:hypothetical protein [Flavobacterium sp. CFBP9031]MDY0989416.1 hypothetical protein [Flavobacterium sp. CFBP9031]
MQIVHSQTKNKTADALFDKMYYIEAAKSYELSVKNGDASKETLQPFCPAAVSETNKKTT